MQGELKLIVPTNKRSSSNARYDSRCVIGIDTFNGSKLVRAIEQLDGLEFYMKFDLEDHLASNHHIGVYAIVEVLKQASPPFAEL